MKHEKSDLFQLYSTIHLIKLLLIDSSLQGRNFDQEAL